MTRLNNAIFLDARFSLLILKLGCSDKALGCWVRALMIADEQWQKFKSSIPRSTWSEQNLNNDLVEVGLFQASLHGFSLTNPETYLDDRLESSYFQAIKPQPKMNLLSIYEKYPRKVGKKRGLKTLESQIKDPEKLQQCHTALDNYIANIKRQKLEAQFVKHFSTWANEWEDWIDDQTGSSKDFSKTNIGLDW